jgi:putative hydrolase
MTIINGYELVADYHTHTVHSHGTGTVAENTRAAAAAGLSEIAITDHGPALAAGLGLRDLGMLEHISRQVSEVNLTQDRVRVLQGVEANVLGPDGRLDLPDRILRRLDIVLAGIHPAAAEGSIAGNARALWRKYVLAHISRRAAAKITCENTKSLIESMLRHPVDIIVHPGLGAAVDPLELARVAARAGAALEINAAHGLLNPIQARAAARAGCYFAINSDAHRPGRVGDLEAGARTARLARVPPERVVNTDLADREDALPGANWGGRRSRPLS